MTIARIVLLFSCAAIVTLAQLIADQFADPDLWGRLSVGAVLDQAGFVPKIDDFSFTARGEAWIDHEWLAGVVFHRLLSTYGEAGLIAFKYAAVLTCLMLVFVLNRWVYAGTVRWSGWSCGLLSPLVVLGFTSSVRSQVFSFVFFMLFLVVLEVARAKGPKRWLLLLLLPAGVVWGNLHGGVAMGLILLGIHGVARLLEGRHADAALLTGLGAGILLILAAANPYGAGYIAVPGGCLDARSRPDLRVGAAVLRTGQLAHPVRPGSGDREHRAGRSRALARAANPLGRLRRSVPRAAQLAIMSLVSIRITTFLALGSAALLPFFAGQVAWSPRPRERAFLRFGFDVMLPVVATLVAVSALPMAGKPWLATVVPDETAAGAQWEWRYPVGAVHFLQASAYRGALLNRFNDGEFLLWNLYPRFRVAVDGRYEEVYPQPLAREIEDFFKEMGVRSSEAAVAFANRSGADFILFRARTATLQAVERDPEWVRIYGDGLYVILARVPACPMPLFLGDKGSLRGRAC